MSSHARGKLQVLHLAFEDPDEPGSGGGAIRTREVCARMSGFDIEVVSCAFPGAKTRIRDGQRWTHAGLRGGAKCLRVASYYASLPAVALTRRHDLLVEDFAPPWTFAFSPLFTREPVVAVVQWMFARQMAEKYGVPLACIEAAGLRLYTNFVVMADAMRRHIGSRLLDADICVAGCAVEEALFEAEPEDRGYALYLGRLDVHQKGLDILLRAAAALPREDFRLKVAGDGKDDAEIRRRVRDAGLEGRVEFLGRVGGEQKIRILSGCRFLVMPSRYETFGMVAAEAMAAAKPVVAFDLPCLAELVPRGAGLLVRAGDEESLTRAMTRLWDEPEACRRMGRVGRASTRRLAWDRIAERQAAFYRHVLRKRSRRPLAERRFEESVGQSG